MIVNDIYATKVLSNIIQSKKDIIALEGAARCSKTWSIYQYILFDYCVNNKGKKITITREKMTWLKATLLRDFEEMVNLYNLPITPAFNINRPDQTYFYLGNEIAFIGVDDRQKLFGRKQDLTWINEIIGEGTASDITEKDFNQIDMRTTGRIFIDYNPKATEHWVYDRILNRKDCEWHRYTIFDNPYAPERNKRIILSYEPTEENIANGTADEINWKIYALGERAVQKGLIFDKWRIVESYPEEDQCSNLGYWLDFGFTNDPTAIGQCVKVNGELFVKEYVYETGLTNIINNRNPEAISIEQRLIECDIPKSAQIFADRAEPKSIYDLRNQGWNIIAAPKFKGSIIQGIEQLKKWKVNILNTSMNIIKERNNYKWKEHSNKGLINEPIDAYNHHIDGLRGLVLYHSLKAQI